MRRELEKAESKGELMAAEKRAEQIIYPQGREVRRFLLTQLHLCVFGQDVVHMVT